MKIYKLLLAVVMMGTFFSVPTVYAENAQTESTVTEKINHRAHKLDQLEKRSQKLKEKASQLRQEGKIERAEKLEKKAERLLKRIEHIKSKN